MAQKLSALATKMTAAAANVATQMGGGTTTAEIQDLAKVLTVLASRNDLIDPAIGLCYPSLPNNILTG
jgi:hypothetical protein